MNPYSELEALEKNEISTYQKMKNEDERSSDRLHLKTRIEHKRHLLNNKNRTMTFLLD